MIKIAACLGFIILGIVINCGGVGDRGYIGSKFWRDPGAFRNGFNGFAGVFVVAAFSFGGTELVGLAAAESANPRKAIPTASKQVFWRIAFFYIINLFIVGLILRSDDERLLNSSGANTKASPFVLAIQDAGIKVLPSIMNGVITIAVISVANSCAFGSTRTMQALAQQGMAPKFLAYIDKAGRPLWCVLIQLAFGALGYLGCAAEGTTVFNWLLAISGLSYFFIWGSICLTHIRFRYVWKAQGYTLDQIPYKPGFGIVGSWIGLILNCLCLIATFYSSLYVSVPPCLSCAKRPQALTSTTAQPQREAQRRGLLHELPRRPHRPRALRLLEGLVPRLAHVHPRARGRPQEQPAHDRARRGGGGGGADVGQPAEAHRPLAVLDGQCCYGGMRLVGSPVMNVTVWSMSRLLLYPKCLGLSARGFRVET